MPQSYNPISFFFALPSVLKAAVDGVAATDAFGPININSGGTALKYRTTTIVRADNALANKLFAICAGKVLIQPTQGSEASKVNLILKPEATFAPLKIKYFIYRGVNKTDLIKNNSLAPKDLQDNNQPQFLRDIWDKRDQTVQNTAVFPLNKIGYNSNQSVNTLIDEVFNYQGTDYTIPKCQEGEHLANFTSSIGLDIVLDYGDYVLEKQENLFNFDLQYARKLVHELDITPFAADPNKLRRYKEYIHQFLDPVAFWGTYINCGTVKTSDGSSNKSLDDIYDKVLIKFQNKSKIYFYIHAEKGRSLGFYDSLRTVEIDLADSTNANVEFNDTNGWPIIIKNIVVAGSAVTGKLSCKIRYSIGDHIAEEDMRASLDVFLPGNKNDILTKEFTGGEPSKGGLQQGTASFLPQVHFEFNQKSNKPCSTAAFFNCNINQPDPTKGLDGGTVSPSNPAASLYGYYNQLWPVNIKTLYNIPSGTDFTYRINFDKSIMVNLAPIASYSACLQNMLVFDYGLNLLNNQIVGRRLYSSIIKRNTNPRPGYEKLDISDIKPVIEAKPADYSKYMQNIYSKVGFDLYRGGVIDGSDAVYSLVLVNQLDNELQASYFHLGITEPQYQILLNLVPNTGADNVYFYLNLLTMPTNSDFVKYTLGISYEFGLDSALTVVYPPTADGISIYTVDGHYFFSKEYSASQEFYTEFAQCEVNFRPPGSWRGEFGFDWIRLGDSSVSGDKASPDRTFKGNIGHFYSVQHPTKKEDLAQDESNIGSVNFIVEPNEYLKLRRLYPLYPKTGQNSLYSGSWLSLYPSLKENGQRTLFPKRNFRNNGDRCLTAASIEIKIKIPIAPSSLKIKFNRTYFRITPNSHNDATLLPNANNGDFDFLEIANKQITNNARTLKINIEALQEFGVNQQILVLSTENNVERVAGVLAVVPNRPIFRKQLKIAFVSCITNINSNTTKHGLTSSNDAKILADTFVKGFNQALIDVIGYTEQDLNLTNLTPSFFSIYKTTIQYNDPTQNYLGVVDHDFLKLQPLSPAIIFADHLVVFALADNSLASVDPTTMVPNNLLAGEAPIGGGSVVLYLQGTPASPVTEITTITHEGAHALNLNHTFSNRGAFTFKKYITDNLMDYINTLSPSVPRVCFYKFQWDKLREYDPGILTTEQ